MKGWIARSAVVGGAFAALRAGGVLAWNRATARAVARLVRPGVPRGSGTFWPEQLEGLPEPVVRYLEFALSTGQPCTERARVRHAGTFAMRPGRWSEFASVQHIAIDPPGFVWDARIRIGPALRVHVRDSYLGGVGAMYAAVGALVPVVNQRGTPEMAAGSLLRYLAEAPWCPTALLPNAGVVWTPVDDRTARATISDADISVSASFHFGSRGEVERVSAERFRDVGGTGVLTPFEGLFWDYQRVHGMLIPMAGEAAWLLPEGRYAFWRGRITDVRYDPVR